MSKPHIILIRERFYSDGTTGTYFVDGVPTKIFSLEDVVRETPGVPVEAWKIKGDTAIPVGTYKIVLSMSKRFGRVMPEILGVKGFEGVRIHGGNDVGDTHGCPLAAKNKVGRVQIQGSMEAFFTDLLRKSGGEGIFTVEGLPPQGIHEQA